MMMKCAQLLVYLSNVWLWRSLRKRSRVSWRNARTAPGHPAELSASLLPPQIRDVHGKRHLQQPRQ